MGDDFPFDVVGTVASGHLAHARNGNSHTCKFTAIFDWLDNHTSPSAGAQTVAIRMFSGEGRGTKEGHPEYTQTVSPESCTSASTAAICKLELAYLLQYTPGRLSCVP